MIFSGEKHIHSILSHFLFYLLFRKEPFKMSYFSEQKSRHYTYSDEDTIYYNVYKWILRIYGICWVRQSTVTLHQSKK